MPLTHFHLLPKVKPGPLGSKAQPSPHGLITPLPCKPTENKQSNLHPIPPPPWGHQVRAQETREGGGPEKAGDSADSLPDLGSQIRYQGHLSEIFPVALPEPPTRADPGRWTTGWKEAINSLPFHLQDSKTPTFSSQVNGPSL